VNHNRRKDDQPPADPNVEPEEAFVPPETPDPVPRPSDQPAKPEAIDSDFTPRVDAPTKDAGKSSERPS
jgi:hypothetical protein